MVLTAPQALGLTNTTITIQETLDLQNEVRLLEHAVRSAAGRQQYFVRYNASILGNPFDDPHDDSNLTDLQIIFRDTMISADYVVSLDVETGYWKFTWENIGVEQEVFVYSIRTIVVPGAVATLTELAIDAYFNNLQPIVTSKARIVTHNGGDIDENDFGATPSVFYEYYAVTSQPDDTDHSSALKTALTLSGLGYTTANMEVYRMIS